LLLIISFVTLSTVSAILLFCHSHTTPFKKHEKIISFCRFKVSFSKKSGQVSYLPTRIEKWQGKIKENYNFTVFVFSYTLEFGRSFEDNFSKEAIP